MDRVKHKQTNLVLRKARIRSTLSGTKNRPRLSVRISNRNVSAQLIDDQAGVTLVSVNSGVKQATNSTLTTKAEVVGVELAKKAKAAKIKNVVFDRNGRKYHGRLKALADAARSEGLEF